MRIKKKFIITGQKGDIGAIMLGLFRTYGFEINGYFKNIDSKADCLLHLAAKSDPASIDEMIESNILYLQEIVKFAEQNAIKKIIYFSAISVYGSPDKEGLNEEDSFVNPDFYGVSKLIGEEYLKNSSLNSVCLRLPAILGVKNKTNLLSRLYLKLKNNEDIIVYNPDRIFNNFISPDNLFQFISNLEFKYKFDYINLASNREITLLKIILYLKKLLDSQSKIEISEDKHRFFNICTKKAETEYGFLPGHPKKMINAWVGKRQEYEMQNMVN